MTKASKTKQLNVRLTPRMHADLGAIAGVRRWDLAQTARVAMEEFIQKYAQARPAQAAAEREPAA